jgi:phage/plasmid-like protein (TIGR03299 family)
MSHGLTAQDTMSTVRQPAWHGLGVTLESRPRSLEDALSLAGLDWHVRQQPVFLAGHDPLGLRAIRGYQANVRSDTGDVLAVVTDAYEVVQNRECFAFLANLIGSELHFETAGSLHGGRQVWCLAALPDWIEVGGDAVRQFMYVRTRHDGTGAVLVLPTAVRVVCANTDRMALDGAQTVFRVRHTGNPSEQLHQARRALQVTVDYGRQFAQTGNCLAGERCTERQLARVLAELYPSGPGDRAARNAQRAREAIMGLFVGGPTVGNAPGSKWSAWNAITEFDQHVRPVRTRDPRLSLERRFVRALEDPYGLQRRAFELIAAA